jgi:sugar phosphate isomerase/epimerase
MKPKIVMCNVFSDTAKLRKFTRDYGFSGIDWSFDLNQLPATPAEESKWVENMSVFVPLEVRYHCPFYQIDLGHNDPAEAKAAAALFRRIVHLVSKAGGRYLTIHIGLGHDSTEPLSWEGTIDNLRGIVQFGADLRVAICLENLAWGWTSKPNLFEKLIRRSGAAVTFDTGHAQACESVRSQLYAIEDFVTPHPDRVLNAHIYHKEISGLGHTPPTHLEDVENCLSLLQEIGCNWWVIEIKEADGLLKTKQIIEDYLTRHDQPIDQRIHAL